MVSDDDGDGPTHTVEALALMVAAMMTPLAIAPIRATAARSLWRRRQLATIEYIVGFFALWVTVGAGFLAVCAIANGGSPSIGREAAPTALGLAALWQLTSIKRRALNAHRRTRPLAPMTPRADRDCLLYGIRSGGSASLVAVR